MGLTTLIALFFLYLKKIRQSAAFLNLWLRAQTTVLLTHYVMLPLVRILVVWTIEYGRQKTSRYPKELVTGWILLTGSKQLRTF
jgi:hypothetical protein